MKETCNKCANVFKDLGELPYPSEQEKYRRLVLFMGFLSKDCDKTCLPLLTAKQLKESYERKVSL